MVWCRALVISGTLAGATRGAWYAVVSV